MQQLHAGDSFAVGPFRIDEDAMAQYLASTGGDRAFYSRHDAVPPMAVAGRALGALIERLSMPAGSVHIGQEVDFLGTARTGEELACTVKVARESSRGGWRILSLDFDVNGSRGPVLKGRTTVMLPQEASTR